jgi:hypothetical protein
MQPDAAPKKCFVANPTATEFAAMLSEHKAALSDFLDETRDGVEAEERCSRAYDALLAARPSQPAVMAMQLRWLIREIEVGDYPDDRGVLEHVARWLDGLAGVLLLSGDAVAQVREALRYALYRAASEPEEYENRPRLADRNREQEARMLRAAILLIDQAGSVGRPP